MGQARHCAKLPAAGMEPGERTEPEERTEAAGAAAEEAATERVFTLEEVAMRNSSREAWLVIHGRVYDVTRFLEEVRPGGAARPGPAGASGGGRTRPRGARRGEGTARG